MKRITIHRYGSERFSGTIKEFRSWYIERLTLQIIDLQAKRLLVQSGTDETVIEFAEGSDDWSVSVEE